MEIVFFDLETTGVETATARICQISMIKRLESGELEKKKLLLNPGVPIPKEASDVHGITDEMVKDCATFKQYAPKIFAYLSGVALAGYNIKHFDIPLLVEEFHRCELNFEPGQIIDCYHIFKEKEKRDLTAALAFYCGKTMENAHDAEADVLATIDIFYGQQIKYCLTEQDCVDFCHDPNTLDLAGKIILVDGVPTYNFGKSKGTAVKDDPGFGQWMLRQPFITRNTKNIVRGLLASL